jgi:hypothetical protein
MVSIYNTVTAMSSGRNRAVRSVEIGGKIRSMVPHQRFLKLNEFVFDDSFKYLQIDLGWWTQTKISNIQRHYAFMTSPTHPNVKIFEFVTIFDDDNSLTTTASASAFLFPRPPGAFIQSMKTDDVEALWKYHLEGEDFLLNEHGVPCSSVTNNDVEYRLNNWVQRQGRYIRKDRLFWIKAPYWFYIRRFKMLGVSVRKQYSR